MIRTKRTYEPPEEDGTRVLADRYWPRGVSKGELVEELLEVHRQGTLTLVYGARDTGHNNAEVLRSYLEERAGGN